jgi:hypothetical protein
MKRASRLVAGYLAAALAAGSSVLVADALALADRRAGMELLRNLASTAPIYGACGLGFTFTLGLGGLLMLRLLRGRGLLAYTAIGAGLGFLAAGLGDGFNRQNFFLVSFTVAGAAAGATFHRVGGHVTDRADAISRQ